MEIWLYIFLILFGPGIVLFIIETAKKEKEESEQTKIIKEINHKNEIGEKLSYREQIIVNNYINEIDQRRGVVFDLLLRDNKPNIMFNYNSTLIDNPSDLRGLLRIIVWLNLHVEIVDYFVVSGKKTCVDLDYESVIIIQHLMKKLAERNSFKINWLYDSNMFAKQLSSARSWAEHQKDKLLFKYKISNNAKNEFSEFMNKLNNYKKETTIYGDIDQAYEEMTKQFLKFVSCL